jgi:hypothetical protein
MTQMTQMTQIAQMMRADRECANTPPIHRVGMQRAASRCPPIMK